MRKTSKFAAYVLAGVLCVSLLAGCSAENEPSTASAENLNTEGTETTEIGNENEQLDSDTLVIAEQGIFSAGGTVIQSDGTFDVANYYTSREGSTSHVDHANVLYQIPEDAGIRRGKVPVERQFPQLGQPRRGR